MGGVAVAPVGPGQSWEGNENLTNLVPGGMWKGREQGTGAGQNEAGDTFLGSDQSDVQGGDQR